MTNIPVYHWSEVCWDLAVADGIDPEVAIKELDHALNIEDPNWDVSQWEKEDEVLNKIYTKLASELWTALLSGKIVARSLNGNPISQPLGNMDFTGVNKPYVTVQDVNSWLKSKGYLQQWTPNIKNVPSKYSSLGYEQEVTILNAIHHLGFDPKSMPINKGGTSGAKSKVRHFLGSQKLFEGSTTFDKAWERLRSNKNIIDK
jgi:hypothetical protein